MSAISSPANSGSAEAKIVKLADLIENIRQERPQLFGNMNDKKVAGIVRSVVLELTANIDSMAEGVVKIQGLGSFSARQVVKSGEDVKVRRIIFRPAKAKTAVAA